MSEQRDYERRKKHLQRLHEARRLAEDEAAPADTAAPPPDVMALASTAPDETDAPDQPGDRRDGGDGPDAAHETTARYRGRPIGRPRPLSAPGANGLGPDTHAPQFRGARNDTASVSTPAVGNDHGETVMDALRRLGAMHAEGRITTADYETKRNELLDRL